MDQVNHRYITANEVRTRLGNISDMTLWRWLADEHMAFPRPLVVNRRRFFKETEIDAWVIRQRTGEPM